MTPLRVALATPGTGRRVFQAGPLTFGVAICHEGWRYPETVRWAVRRGAHAVFHPQFHEAEPGSYRPTAFADPANTFHEKAAFSGNNGLLVMALDTPSHQAVQRATQAARNTAARYGLAQQRGQELAALRREVARLRALEAKVRALFAHPHATIPAEDWRALRNALGLGEG